MSGSPRDTGSPRSLVGTARSGRSLLAQSLSATQNPVNAEGAPLKLWVTVLDTAAGGEHLPNPARGCSGLYMLAESARVNNLPVWEQLGGDCRIESSKKGHWSVTEHTTERLMCITPGSGAMPHECGPYRSKHFVKQRNREKDAALVCGNGVWAHQDVSGDASISSVESKVHGFRYGRAVVASSDIKEDNGHVRIPLGCLGIVMGPSPHPSGVRVKFDSFDAPFNVNHNELDLAEGPEVNVMMPDGHLRPASIINVSETRVKIHYHGRPKSEDEWFEKDSTRLLPVFHENPEGFMDCMSDSDISSSEDMSISNIPLGRRGTYL